MLSKPYLLITPGDVRGIGYEIILKIFPKIKNFVPIMISPKFVLESQIKKINCYLKPVYLPKNLLLDILDINYPKTHILCVDTNTKNFLKDNKNIYDRRTAGFYTIQTLDLSIEIIKSFINNKINFSLLTMPISKDAVSKYLNKNFSGHTEYISTKFNIKNFSMLMIGKHIPYNYKVLLLTRHLPLKDVSKNLRIENIVEQTVATTKFIETKLKIPKIEILFCGLNPHLGENGKIGTEEKTVLKKSVQIITNKLKNNKIIFPILTEKAFDYAKNKNNVLIVTLYHDQAMVPLKLLCGHNIANLTVGLPFVRISPGHGTAFDIAGKNVANVSPTLFCINLLNEIVNN
jgi:4-hydroxythreonine-4-phosphate dehydrogenase